jgi:HK97 family phage prohead protease
VATTTDAVRAAADLRRLAADAERHEHGDNAFRQFRLQVSGRGPARRVTGGPQTLIRASTEPRNGDGKEFVHTSGYYTVYDRKYQMWDDYGKYHEWTAQASGAKSLARKPEVCFLTLHNGMAMARTTTGTLELREDATGGWHDAWLNPERTDVADLAIAIRDGDVPQMSFAFMIPSGGGYWNADFTEFKIAEYDIDGGDVSAVNNGANPYTDITARTEEMLDDIRRMPAGAQREALARLSRDGDLAPRRPTREHIEVRREERALSEHATPMLRRLHGRLVRTHARYVDIADQAGLSVADLISVPLPWYEIRSADPVTVHTDEGDAEEPEVVESTDVYIFEEIGGSFGTSAKTFAKDLGKITTPRIALHINSPGGLVRDGLAIHSTLLHHPSWITSFVDGIAASAAGLIALGGDEVVTMPGGQWMMHDASMLVDGNPAELTDAADFLDKQSTNLAGLYATRMKISVESAREMMTAETWAFADEAVSLGLADRIGARSEAKTPPADLVERMARKHDLTRFGYRYASRSAAPDPLQTRAAPTPAATREVSPPRTGRSITLIEARIDLAERS